MRKYKKMKINLLIILIFFTSLVVLFLFFNKNHNKSSQEETKEDLAKRILPSQQEKDEDVKNSEESELADFDSLWKINKEIIGYLSVEGTDIQYPILQASEDAYYLNHDIYKKESKSGELFIENYNTNDFKDPVTIIYGHNMKDGSYFGQLQELYSNGEWFNKNQEIHLYLPDRNIIYQVKAAIPYSPLHILYYYDFSQSWIYNSFMEDVYSVRSMNANFSETDRPTGTEPVLILSTCLDSDHSQRYIVMAEEKSLNFKNTN